MTCPIPKLMFHGSLEKKFALTSMALLRSRSPENVVLPVDRERERDLVQDVGLAPDLGAVQLRGHDRFVAPGEQRGRVARRDRC